MKVTRHSILRARQRFNLKKGTENAFIKNIIKNGKPSNNNGDTFYDLNNVRVVCGDGFVKTIKTLQR